MERVLDIALAHNAQMSDHLNGGPSEHEVFAVGERLRRRDDDRVAGVDAKRVKVLHVAHGDAVVAVVADHLVLELLPPAQVLVNEDLRASGESLGGHGTQFVVVGGKSRPQAPQCVGGPDQDGVPDLVGRHDRLVNGGGTVRERNRFVDFFELLAEDLAVFGGFNDRDLRPEHFDAGRLELSRVPQFDADIEGGLPTHGNDDTVRLFLPDNVHDDFRLDGEEVHAVGGPRLLVLLFLGGLDCGNVGIDEDDLNAFFLEGLDALRSGIIEFARLSDTESTTPDHQDFFVCFAFVRESVLQYQWLWD